MLKFSLLMIFLTVLAACTRVEQVPPKQQPQAQPAVEYQNLKYRLEQKQEAQPRSEVSNPAVVFLLEQAQARSDNGDFEQSVSFLERALRIAPREPIVHYRLAQAHLMQGQASSALQIAFKGKSLVSSGSQLASDFWRLIGDCYVRLGDTAKAGEAYDRI